MQLINTYAYVERLKVDRFDVTFNYKSCGYTIEDTAPMRPHFYRDIFCVNNTNEWKRYEVNSTISTQ